MTVLISSHILDELSRLATHYGFVNNGNLIKEITAEELEKACRKCVYLEVTNTKSLVSVLDMENMEYDILSGQSARVFGSINISKLVRALDKLDCELISIREQDESLENYFINLVGGDHNV